MKKLLLVPLFIFLGILFTACEDPNESDGLRTIYCSKCSQAFRAKSLSSSYLYAIHQSECKGQGLYCPYCKEHYEPSDTEGYYKHLDTCSKKIEE